MAKWICSTCEGEIPAQSIRSTPAHRSGEAMCPHCCTRVKMPTVTSSQRSAYLFCLVVMIFLAPFIFSDSGSLQMIGLFGVLVYVLGLVHRYLSARRMVPITGPRQ